jgi:hypothetical protein
MKVFFFLNEHGVMKVGKYQPDNVSTVSVGFQSEVFLTISVLHIIVFVLKVTRDWKNNFFTNSLLCFRIRYSVQCAALLQQYCARIWKKYAKTNYLN